MCGRFTLTVGLGEIKERFLVDEVSSMESMDHLPRYNIAPTQSLPIVVREGAVRKLVSMRWGLIPRWATDPSIGNRLINARSETLTQKPAFRRSFQRHRCLVPADSFYEWMKKESGGKQPMRITVEDGGLFAFAGLWDRWTGPEGEAVYSFTIITTRPNEKVREVHNRMPAILHRSVEDLWLDPDVRDPAVLQPVLEPYEAEDIRIYPVSRIVNSPKNDRPECIRPIA
ncbi:putative SOS response-associated peptidase YedK [Melghirimyces profundicolus]|uniref:Abasic site processing protein n=1 Tax=Melghirimyces profundicolus TaxID=1242148 RepID=A0A2T6B5Z2_9BACL|nr:SOS response-associated peptidase [Melghirimyces profundicolus]PTX51478.1 putative SOS response-associated peptidase YedK [Melghirimyces profundicolus]